RLGHAPASYRGPPHVRSAGGHAAHPATRWALQCLHGTAVTRPGRVSPATGGERIAPLRPPTTTIEHRGGFCYGDPTAYDTLRGHHQPDARAAGAGHGALASALG